MKASVNDNPRQELLIRPATITDIALITKVHTASWKSAYKNILSKEYLENEVENEKKAHWNQELSHPTSKYNFVLLAIERSVPVGFIGVYDVIDGSYDAFIDNLHIMPDQKGKGVGQKLMAAAAEKLDSFNKKSVYLWVYNDNLPAFGFYEKLGGIIGDKSICIIHGKEITQTRFYWNDFTSLKSIS